MLNIPDYFFSRLERYNIVMNAKYFTEDISLKVNISIADDFFAKDSALLQLRKGQGDKNDSIFNEEDFIKEIINRNLVVAMLREDPIAYAIVNDGVIVEHYIGWSFKDSTLEDILLEKAIQLTS